jgi:hypothetical protein
MAARSCAVVLVEQLRQPGGNEVPVVLLRRVVSLLADRDPALRGKVLRALPCLLERPGRSGALTEALCPACGA